MEILNPQQREAVLHTGSPLLILAGAGSGKTRVITTKIAWLIERMGIDPRSILAVTFTNKAADEMHQRVLGMVPEAKDVMVRTFHSFGAWLLRRNAHLLGMNSNFTIYDDEDSLTLLHSLYPKFKRNELSPFIRMISRAKDYGLGPEDELWRISQDSRFPEKYEEYEKRLREIGNADFGDLILRPVELLKGEKELRQRLRSRFKVVLVDEYQDSNVAQYELLKQLAGPETYLCVVGDDDQSIYRFRGAEVKNILSFPEEFPNTKIIRLEQNYRSTGRILRIASEVVSRNQDRLGKSLWTDNPEGPKAEVVFLQDQAEEADYCMRLLEDGNLEGTAILYRTNAQSRNFETRFVRHGIPYKIVGSLRFYDREEVKDVLALLGLYLNPRDEVAFRRVVNKPPRGIGSRSLEMILDEAHEGDGNLLEAMKRTTSRLNERAREGVNTFLEVFEKMDRTLKEKGLVDFIKAAVQLSGILEYHRKQDEISLTQKVGNIEELVSAARDYADRPDGLTLFLEDLELDRSRIAGNDPSLKPGVTLITMHNTKGLEFDRVIITGMEEGIFPSRPDESDDDLEEERRIFYVSITRAKKELYFTSCRRRLIWGRINNQRPSRFLEELPKQEVELNRRYSLSGTGFENAGFGASSSASPFEESSDASAYTASHSGSWKKGTRVYHDEYGPGVVWKSLVEGENELVFVRFETGRTAKFIPKYSALEVIADDWG
jgi:DNA helicase-2/ATP-dependent DNA helicase PcrA